MKEAKTRFTNDGSILDTDRPAKRLKVADGMYSTEDLEEIAFLEGYSEFGNKGPDGFNVVVPPDPKDEIEAIMKKSGLSKKELLAAVSED